MVAEFQRGCYHNSTVPVKEYLEVIEGEEDSFETKNSTLPDQSGETPRTAHPANGPREFVLQLYLRATRPEAKSPLFDE
jgi:hypothetical protein